MPRSTPGNRRQQDAASRSRLASLGLCQVRGCGLPARGPAEPPASAGLPTPPHCPACRQRRALAARRRRSQAKAAPPRTSPTS